MGYIVNCDGDLKYKMVFKVGSYEGYKQFVFTYVILNVKRDILN